ncbi:hypothetical protein BDN71DRAFT_1437019 [Pleurotus eryngii]|uniref:DEAD/DEAH-box helicase domain-containing protein n=1 Tax=Pleurotus eryngii TaxID=5323 RepID=A0A9P6D8X5_PLEER|nr:hypothetical protein BDN71DRAFT_1437019 [Pleurotus eryngii]
MSSSGLGNGSRVRELLECLVPHKVHDYITEGICQALDGQHLLSVVRTGGGKTGYFYGFMLVLRALSRLPRTHPMARNIPQHSKIVIIYPTKGLVEEMESTFRKLSLSVVAINEDTLVAARRRDEDLWTTAKTTSMILLSPEQLVSPHFSSLLDNKEFWNSICALGIDEMHLIHDWDTLGLKAGTYSFMRCSNIRHDIKLVIRTLRHGLSGWTFPDLRWIVEGTRKTIIYGDTITLIYRLLVYFWHEVTPSIPRQIRFRMYASICDQEYNSETCRLFEVDPHCQVVLATDAAKVGNDWSAIADAIILNPKDPNDIIQKSGRVGQKHGAVRSPRAFVYFTKAQMDKAVNLSINPTGNGKKGKQGTGKDEWLTEDMRAKTSRKVSTMRPALTEKQSEELRKDILTWQHNIWQNSNNARIRNMPLRSLLDKSAVDKLVARIMAISEAEQVPQQSDFGDRPCDFPQQRSTGSGTSLS